MNLSGRETIVEFLQTLSDHGVEISVVDDKIRLNAPQGKLNNTLRRLLLTRKAEIIDYYRRPTQPAAISPAPAQKRPRPTPTGPRPLSFNQQEIWLYEQLFEDQTPNLIPFGLRIFGEVDDQRLKESFQAVLQQSRALQGVIEMVDHIPHLRYPPRPNSAEAADSDGEAPSQRVQLSIIERNLAQLQPATKANKERAILNHFLRKPFDLTEGPLLKFLSIRLAEEERMVVLVGHRLLIDGESLPLIFAQAASRYAATEPGEARETEEIETAEPSPFLGADASLTHIETGREKSRRGDDPHLEKALSYWEAHFSSGPRTVHFPRDFIPHAEPYIKTKPATHLLNIPAALGHRFNRLPPGETDLIETIFLGAYTLLLGRYAGQQDITLGILASQRSGEPDQPRLGQFEHVLPIRQKIDHTSPLDHFLREVSSAIITARQNRRFPFGRLFDRLNRNDPSSAGNHLPFRFRLRHNTGHWSQWGGHPAAEVDELWQLKLCTSGSSLFLDLQNSVYPDPAGGEDDARQEGDLRGRLVYDSRLYNEQTIIQFGKQLVAIAETLYQTLAQKRVQTELGPLLSEATAINRERAEADPTADNIVPFPHEALLHEIFEDQVRRTPDAAAVITPTETIRYRDLNRRVNRLAHALRAAGVEPRDRVALWLPRSADTVVTTLAISKCGATFTLLDGDQTARLTPLIATRLAEHAVHWLLANDANQPAEPLPPTIKRLNLTEIEAQSATQPVKNLRSKIKATDPLFLLFATPPSKWSPSVENRSGAQQEMETVLGTHRAVINQANWLYRTFSYQTTATQQPQGEIAPEPAAEAETDEKPIPRIEHSCLLGSLDTIDPISEIFSGLIRGKPLVVVPATATQTIEGLVETLATFRVSRIFLSAPRFEQLCRHTFEIGKALPDLTTWFVIGPPLPRLTWQTFLKHLPSGRLTTLYRMPALGGDVIYRTYLPPEQDGDRVDRVLTGREVESERLGRPVDNMSLELVDRTGRPVPNGIPGEVIVRPHGDLGSPEQRFATGLIGRRSTNGVIHYIGERRNRVIINRCTIDLKRIEDRLIAHEQVEDAVLSLHRENIDTPQIYAYLKLAAEVSEPPPLYKEDIFDHLKRFREPFVTPDRFYLVPQISYLADGSVNRNALALETTIAKLKERPYLLPREEREVEISAIWKELLGIEAEINMTDHFFELGGHTLLAYEMTKRVSARLNAPLDFKRTMQHLTIQQLGQIVSEKRTRTQIRKKNGSTRLNRSKFVIKG